MKISVCIATHERAELLAGTLEAVARQGVAPGDVVVSDSSATPATREVVSDFAARHPELRCRYVRSERRALPWQRWWAFTHSIGDWVLFIDDDVRLDVSALDALARSIAAAGRKGPVAGMGFVFTWDGEGPQPERDTASPKERWLRTAAWPSGALTPGGQTVSFFGLAPDQTVPVDALWGGAMAFPRHVLAEISCLDNLAALYEAGIGRGEDGVLSHAASRFGRLYLVNRPLARHPRERRGPAPYARSGWKLGMTSTWGRAHTMRWLASDATAYRREWSRLVALEWLRAARAVTTRPWHAASWAQAAGVAWGTARSLACWSRIPASAQSDDAAASSGRAAWAS